MPPARDSEAVHPVERSASGAAAAFDGNFTHDLDSWLFPNNTWEDSKVPAMLDQLMMWTAAGHLAWCVFVPHGFRL